MLWELDFQNFLGFDFLNLENNGLYWNISRENSFKKINILNTQYYLFLHAIYLIICQKLFILLTPNGN